MTRVPLLKAVTDWIDRDLKAHPKHPSLVLGALPFGLAAVASHWLSGPVETLGWIVGVGLSILWIALCLWRIALHVREEAIKGDEAFDRKGKYLLPPEYHDSESVTAANRRKRRLKRRQGADRTKTP